MELRFLGELEVCEGGQVVEGRPAKLRALLAMLLLHGNEVVSTERLVEALWSRTPPPSATNTLHGYVSHLRNVLGTVRGGGGGTLLQTRPPGYVLAVEAERLDAWRFERLAVEGRRALGASDARGAAGVLSEALSLWRGRRWLSRL